MGHNLRCDEVVQHASVPTYTVCLQAPARRPASRPCRWVKGCGSSRGSHGDTDDLHGWACRTVVSAIDSLPGKVLRSQGRADHPMSVLEERYQGVEYIMSQGKDRAEAPGTTISCLCGAVWSSSLIHTAIHAPSVSSLSRVLHTLAGACPEPASTITSSIATQG